MGGKFKFTKLAVGSVKNPAKGFTLLGTGHGRPIPLSLVLWVEGSFHMKWE
jgi:hypothetical protein